MSASGTEAFVWTQAGGMVGLGDLPGGAFSSNAAAASFSGNIIVGSATSDDGTQAVRWVNGVIQPLGDLPGGAFSSTAAAVGGTLNGNIVVGTATGPQGQRAFIWDQQSGMRDLGEYLAALGVNMTGWRLDAATGISADGTVVVGYGQSPTLIQTGFVAHIPRYCEPNCDGSTNPPVLNVNDFVCFNNRFALGDPYANCDASTLPPVLNVNDYVCFISKYGAGCP
jgi:hypothetical protein